MKMIQGFLFDFQWLYVFKSHIFAALFGHEVHDRKETEKNITTFGPMGSVH
jgi:hypothetical protein